MNAFAAIFAWMALGLALRRTPLPERAFAGLNRFIVWVPLSAVILRAIRVLDWAPSYWAPVSSSWIVFGASAVLFAALGRKLGWGRAKTGALTLVGGLGNTSFLGYPLLRALYGERALSVAVLVDQPGSFLALSTAGIAAASYYSSGRASARETSRRLAAFPPAWALLAAVLLHGTSFPAPAEKVLELAARLLTPLALISVGAALRFDAASLRRERGPLAWGLGWKLAAAPALIALLFAGLGGLRGEAVCVTVLESAMAPMITASIVAAEHGLDPELSALMVGVGAPLSLLTVPLWAKVLAALGV